MGERVSVSDSPVLSSDKVKVSVPLKQTDDGGTHFNIRYKQVKDGVSLSLYVPFSISSLVLVFPFCRPSVLCYALLLCSLRIKRGLSGKRCGCLSMSPFKTCLLAQAIKWKSQRSMPMGPLSLPRSTVASSAESGNFEPCSGKKSLCSRVALMRCLVKEDGSLA